MPKVVNGFSWKFVCTMGMGLMTNLYNIGCDPLTQLNFVEICSSSTETLTVRKWTEKFCWCPTDPLMQSIEHSSLSTALVINSLTRVALKCDASILVLRVSSGLDLGQGRLSPPPPKEPPPNGASRVWQLTSRLNISCPGAPTGLIHCLPITRIPLIGPFWSKVYYTIANMSIISLHK